PGVAGGGSAVALPLGACDAALSDVATRFADREGFGVGLVVRLPAPAAGSSDCAFVGFDVGAVRRRRILARITRVVERAGESLYGAHRPARIAVLPPVAHAGGVVCGGGPGGAGAAQAAEG